MALMDSRQAAEALAGAELVPMVQGSMAYVKELLDKCLQAEIPAVAGNPPGAGKG